MKRNDYVFDKNRGIGIIKAINDKARVLFDNLQIYEYDIKSLNVIDERIIDFIKKSANERLSFNGDALHQIPYMFKINITYNNNILTFSCIFDGNNKTIKVSIDGDKQDVSCSFHSRTQYCNHINSVILYLNQKLIFLDRFDINMDKYNDKLRNASLEFIDKFFNLKHFKNLCTLISQQSFETVYHFCKDVCELDIDNDCQMYLLMMAANNVDLDIAKDLLDSSYQQPFYMFTDAFSNSLKGNNQIVIYDMFYSSICFLKDDKAYEWVKSCFNRFFKIQLLLSKNRVPNLIFIEIIKNAKEIDLYWNLKIKDNSPYMNYYYVNMYHELIFNNTSEENKLFLIDNGHISHIPDDFSETFDAIKTIKYHRLMSDNIKLNNINKYFEEIVKINPQLIVDMIVEKKNTIKNKTEMKLIERVMPYLTDTKYLEVFLKSGIDEKGFYNFSETLIIQENDYD